MALAALANNAEEPAQKRSKERKEKALAIYGDRMFLVSENDRVHLKRAVPHF